MRPILTLTELQLAMDRIPKPEVVRIMVTTLVDAGTSSILRPDRWLLVHPEDWRRVKDDAVTERRPGLGIFGIPVEIVQEGSEREEELARKVIRAYAEMASRGQL